MALPKVTIPALQARKGLQKFTMLTAYDVPIARVVDEAGIDVILVGDSLGAVMLGYGGTAPVTMDEMIHHAKAVSRIARRALLVGDMPFMSYQADTAEAIRNAGRHIKEAGMDCVKLEGTAKQAPIARAIVDAGIAVIGHIGLTLQTAASLGGVAVQGGDSVEAARRILDDALAMEAAGCWAVLMEAVPAELGALITRRLKVPTIGIGAGPACDGQVLLTHEMLGLFPGLGLPWGNRYLDAGTLMGQAIRQYADDIHSGTFPGAANSFPIDAEILRELES
ncbi:MAG: 3-methyl-2-oxobutanoate hydroxymethyltransferase [Kouleothrix sp.]|jgi:3-methyl-2-oxobutanoate hydroxymethyltransferase|nr:3-methyl-2-oxobutanoate hydroxymethyltransferase [Kouleothrix sp.]